jgi:hypothetical protein
MARPIGSSLHPVPADSHDAPPSRTILRVVVEGPLASPARLEPRPRSFDLRNKRRPQEATERPGEAGRAQFEPHLTVSSKADHEARIPREAVQYHRGGRIHRRSVMRQQETAERLADLPGTPDLECTDACAPGQQGMPHQPAAEVGRRGEFLCPQPDMLSLDVVGVDELLKQAQRPRRRPSSPRLHAPLPFRPDYRNIVAAS